MADLKESPSQTAGPYVHIGCLPSLAGLQGMYGESEPGSQMISGSPNGERIRLSMLMFDGDGAPLTDAMIEIWQAGPDGGFGTTPGFMHWGRQATDAATGEVVFDTLKPAATDGQAPHVFVWLAARGINVALQTRIYFPDEDNSNDPVYALAGDRASTLLAQKRADGYHHDIYLQGAAETVFFDV